MPGRRLLPCDQFARLLVHKLNLQVLFNGAEIHLYIDIRPVILLVIGLRRLGGYRLRSCLSDLHGNKRLPGTGYGRQSLTSYQIYIVDVSDEVKTESQINVEKEDTKINQTVVENYLQDTVVWVESTSTMITYTEVEKSNIPDPSTLAMDGSFTRLSKTLLGAPTEYTTDPGGIPS